MPPALVLLLAGSVALAVVLIRKARAAKARDRIVRAEHPWEPWLWRSDWSVRTARHSEQFATGVLWGFTIFWNLLSLPVVFIWRDRVAREPSMAFFAIFPLIGVALIGVSVYYTLRRWKYGVSVCRFDRLPIPLGATLRGEVDARVGEIPESGFEVRLLSIRRTIRGTGKERTQHEAVLWQDEQRVGAGLAMPTPNGMRIPFRFDIPRDAEQTDESEVHNAVYWRLEVRGDVPGVDYHARFELPVFRIETRQHILEKRDTAAAWEPPPGIEIGFSRTGGEEIVIHPRRRVGDWIAYAFFLALWFSVAFGVFAVATAPWVAAILTVVGLLVLAAAVDFLLGRTAISADRTMVETRRSWLGIGRTRRIDAAQVEAIVPRIGLTHGTRGYYDLDAHLRTGETVRIAKSLRNRADAEGIAARITRAVGSGRPRPSTFDPRP